MRRVLAIGLCAAHLAAPAAAEESSLSLVGRMAALGGYALGALAECGLPDEDGKRRAEQLLLAVGLAAHDPADLDNAKHQLVLGLPAGREAVRSKAVSCDAANARLPALLDALSGAP